MYSSLGMFSIDVADVSLHMLCTVACPMGISTSVSKQGRPQFLQCSGNGRCMTLREISKNPDYINYFDNTPYTDWDTDRIQGCVCEPGYQGVSCEYRVCPFGDDPNTPGVSEVEYIDCTCTACTGGITLTFKGRETDLIPHDATAPLIQTKLQALTTIDSVSVLFMQGAGLCSAAGSITRVTFLLPQGPQQGLKATSLGGLVSTVATYYGGASSDLDSSYVSVAGTKEYVECSGRGLCNNATATCECFLGYSSSNGLGLPGTRADCGHRSGSMVQVNVGNSTRTVSSACPVVKYAICSGHGTCDGQYGVCTCDTGYGGHACEQRTCLTTTTWFGSLGTMGHLGTPSVCGGVGYCNADTGDCYDCGGVGGIFQGSRCESLSCWGSTATESGTLHNDGSHNCNGHGACLTLRELASHSYSAEKERRIVSYDTPWDADMIRACSCARVMSVDNQYDDEYVNRLSWLYQHLYNSTFVTLDYRRDFYRGPYAYAATDFAGYNCAHAACPRGDDPLTGAQVNEIQRLKCRATAGSFHLIFRENTTLPILHNDTERTLQMKLEQLFTIGRVAVTFGINNTHTVCNSSSPVYIEFLSEFGDVPMLKGVISSLTHTSFSITEYQKGTKEDVECSRRGICDDTKGICSCFPGFSSSNGTIDAIGSRGDCTYFNPFYTVQPIK